MSQAPLPAAGRRGGLESHPAEPVGTPRWRPPADLPWPIVAAIVAAWALAAAAQATGAGALLHHDALAEEGPSAVGALLFLAAWQVMIAAMMLPSTLPLLRLFAVASACAPKRSRALAAFIAGYAVVWSAFGAAAFASDLGLHAVVDASSWLSAHQWALGGAVLALAGLFQFTRLKDACLDNCRHPAQFLTRYYERGVAGGFRVGARHGVFCLGCCWALMLVMFAAGFASLLVMALLTAVMVHEKTRPAGARMAPVSGVVLLALAAWVLAYSAWSASIAT